MRSWMRADVVAVMCACSLGLVSTGCKPRAAQVHAAGSGESPSANTVARPAPQIPDADTPPPERVDGFDARRAFDDASRQVGFGARPSGSTAITQAQDYLFSQLSAAGCSAETDAFNAQTPSGVVPMKNILVKIPGDRAGILMLATHYDTKRLDLFVGADDGASSTAVMLEIARQLCAQPQHHAVWIAFFDGEEAVGEWSDTDSRYGSREMAAKMAMSGDLKKVQAFLLADIVGSRTLRFKRELNSTKALTDLVWTTASRLGYSGIFVSEGMAIEDDHLSFLKRGVPCVDVIDLEIPYWHTPQDTLDKISAKSMAITGHVFLETIKQLQAK
jgi:glutaminyl-peptide cyclotransferase